jgi:hypothetical protein
MLNVSRAKNRESMAKLITELATQHKWSCERDAIMSKDREIWLYLSGPRGLSLTFTLEGDNRQQRENVFVLAWHIRGRNESAKLSDHFGLCAGGSVNPYHRQKCTGVSYSWDATIANLIACLIAANSGEAFCS